MGVKYPQGVSLRPGGGVVDGPSPWGHSPARAGPGPDPPRMSSDPHPFLGSASEHTRQQLRAARFTRVTRDVYLRAPATADLRARTVAARLVLPSSVACLGTAALLTKLPVVDDGTVHLARPGEAAWSVRQGITVHRYDVRDDEVLDLAGLPVTDGPRTLADLAAYLALEQLVAVGDVVLRRYGEEAVLEAVRRAARRPGVVLMRQAVPLLDARAGSPAESRVRVRLHAAGFDRLVPGVRITDEAGGWLADPDLADEEARVAVQHDGDVHFEDDDSGKALRRRRHDAARDDLSRERGWEVVVSTALDEHHPERLVDRVAAAYRRAARVLGPHVLPPHLRGAA